MTDAKGEWHERRESAGEGLNRLCPSHKRAANIIRLKGTNTTAGIQCRGKWTEEKERREMYGEKTTSQAGQREGRAGNQIAMEKKKERRGYNPRE